MSDAEANPYGLWELAVLSLLRECALHPYEIQRLLKERRKDDVLVLKRGSLYHAIKRLADAGLIEAQETSREGRRPERTTYAITTAGREALPGWLKNLVAQPQHENSSFMGAVSFLFHLTPQEAVACLQSRIASLQAAIATLNERLAGALPRIGRIHLVELEYARAMQTAELVWVKGLVTDLEAGRLKWDWEKIMKAARPPAASPSKRKLK
jgi:DNA-binding PadR family transcriptional regulator